MAQQDGGDEDALRDITGRIHVFNIPDPEFDAVNASDEERWRYGIPPRPTEKRLTDLWDLMFVRPLVFVTSALTIVPTQVPVTGRAIAASRGRHESSLNWSGVYITPRDGKQFTEVYGRWHVPTASLPGGVVAGTESQSSVWIGLDGARRYFDSTLPQLGSAQYVNPSTTPPYFLWWQWWMRDNPLTYSFAIIPLAVAPTHEILAQLVVVNPVQVLLLIKNLSTNKPYRPLLIDAPFDYPAAVRQAQVSGATAEWIVERPSDPAAGPYPLPRYGQVAFTQCYAVQSPAPGGIPAPSDTRTLVSARMVSMYQFSGTPQRRIPLSRPEYPQIDQDLVNYVGP
jgi:hypothetical protein